MATLRRRKVKQNGRAYQYWVVDFSYSENGKPRRKQRHFTKKADAELFKAEIERQLARARYADLEVELGPPDVSLTEWLDRFARSVKPNCSETYFRIVLYTLKRLRGFLQESGVHTTRALKREHFAAYAEGELGRGLKPKSVANNLQVVKRAVVWGIEEGLLDERLRRSFPKVKVLRHKRRVLSKAEIERVLGLFQDDPLYPVVLTALYTGMRRGELVGLRCEHVDLETGVISLPADITKNNRPRSIRVHDRLRPVLRRLVDGRQGWVFTEPRKGGQLTPDYVSRHFSRMVGREPELADVSFHCLRHTCATRLAAAGMSPFDLQRVMGHQSINTTMIYVNLAKEEAPDMSLL